jgi:hypothetical protein
LIIAPIIGGNVLHDKLGFVFVWSLVFFDDSVTFHFNLTDALILSVRRILLGTLPPLTFLILFSPSSISERYDLRFIRPIYNILLFIFQMLWVGIWLNKEIALTIALITNFGWISLIFSPGVFWTIILQFYLIVRCLLRQFKISQYFVRS